MTTAMSRFAAMTVVGLTAAGLAVMGPAQTAQAVAFDPTVLCSATGVDTPIALADYGTALDTLSADSAAAALASGVSTDEQYTEAGSAAIAYTAKFDTAQGRFSYEDYDTTTSSWWQDVVLDSTTQLVLSYQPTSALSVAVLKALGLTYGYRAQPLAPADATPGAIAGTWAGYALDSAYFPFYYSASSVDPTSLNCNLATGSVIYTAAWADGVSFTVTIGFDSTTGAVASVSASIGDTAGVITAYTDDTTVTYGATTVGLPSPILSVKRWNRGIVWAKFPVLRKATVTAAVALVKKAANNTNAKRVAAVRKLAAAQAKSFTTKLKIKATASKITNGAKIQVTDPGTGTVIYYFTLTVKGKTIVVKRTSHA